MPSTREWIDWEELPVRLRLRACGLKFGVGQIKEIQKEPVDEDFLCQLQECTHSQALILMGNFNHLNICWQNNMASCKGSRSHLECLDGNFLVQVLDKPIRSEALLDTVLTNVEKIIKDI